jgi:hypothetical protein
VAGVTFSAFPNLTGGTGMDIFKFSAGKGVTGAINGGGGGDWLDYAAYTTAVTVNLGACPRFLNFCKEIIMPARLMALDGGSDIPLNRPMVMVGRHPACDARLDSPRVSRRHCCLHLQEGSVVVRDLSSTNGIQINDTRVKLGRLRPGDELSIAHCRYRFHDEPDPDRDRDGFPMPRPVPFPTLPQVPANP